MLWVYQMSLARRYEMTHFSLDNVPNPDYPERRIITYLLSERTNPLTSKEPDQYNVSSISRLLRRGYISESKLLKPSFPGVCEDAV